MRATALLEAVRRRLRLPPRVLGMGSSEPDPRNIECITVEHSGLESACASEPECQFSSILTHSFKVGRPKTLLCLKKYLKTFTRRSKTLIGAHQP